MIVYLLVVVLVKEPNFASKTIDIQTMVFKDSARCIRNAEANRKLLQDKYDQVSITCTERKLE